MRQPALKNKVRISTTTTLLSAPNPYIIVSVQKIGRVVIYIAPIFFGKASAALSRARSYLILPALVLPVLWLSAVNSAFAQDTLYIGGSGQTGMEIDLSALDQIAAPRSASKGLRHPGLAGGGFAPVTLHLPGDSPSANSTRATAPAPKPAQMATPAMNTRTKKAVTTQKLVAPGPAPDPLLAKAPQEMTPENMTKEERATAKKRNKDSASSTSSADETALLDLDPPTAAQAKPKPQPKAAQEAELAALDPAKEAMSPVLPPLPGETMQIKFGAGESALPKTAQVPLSSLAAALGQDKSLRLQLKAYASGSGDSASQARRLSLSRALAVRSELIEQGVRSTRIDVRALGNKSENGTSDRVDVILVQR